MQFDIPISANKEKVKSVLIRRSMRMFIKVYRYVSYFFTLSHPPFLIACFLTSLLKLRPFETRESALPHTVFFSLSTVAWY